MINFKMLQIDAVTYDDQWVWNNTYILEDNIEVGEGKLTPAKIVNMFEERGYLDPKDRDKLWVDMSFGYDNFYEIQIADTGEPIFALSGTEG